MKNPKKKRFFLKLLERTILQERFLGFFEKRKKQQSGSWGSSVFHKKNNRAVLLFLEQEDSRSVCFRTAPQEWFVQEEVLFAEEPLGVLQPCCFVLVFLSLLLRSSSCFRKEPTGSWGFSSESFFFLKHRTTPNNFSLNEEAPLKKKTLLTRRTPRTPRKEVVFCVSKRRHWWCSVFQKEDIGGVLCFKDIGGVVFCVSEAPSLF